MLDHHCIPRDSVDRLLADWWRVRPDLEMSPVAIMSRLERIRDHLDVELERLFTQYGLSDPGLVERQPDPGDKRNSRITLTDRGRALFERVVPAHLDNERRLLASLSGGEQELLATLLRKLLVEFEGSLPLGDAPLRLGMTLAPAHVAITMQRAVGLAPETGLLVRTVEEGGAAAQAGVRQGDVLVRAGRYDLRSVVSLYAAMAEAAGRGRLRLDY